MTNNEALKLIQNRISELINNQEIQEKIKRLRGAGLSDDELKRWVTNVAISTLCGA